MTQFGKCDTCRQRKVKCDEKHPVCGRCMKAGRECKYGTFEDPFRVVLSTDPSETPAAVPKPDPEDSRDAGRLRLRSTRVAAAGAGFFQTFVSMSIPESSDQPGPGNIGSQPIWYIEPREPSLPRVPIPQPLPSVAPSQLRKWISLNEIITSGLDTKLVLGEWAEYIPERLQAEGALHCAMECFLDGSKAFANRSAENLAKSHKSNAKALRSIRSTIIQGGSVAILQDVCIAICLLRIVELLLRASTGEFKLHQTGVIKLLLHVSKQQRQLNRLTRTIFLHCAPWDTDAAIWAGRDSVFDSPAWLARYPLPGTGCNVLSADAVHDFYTISAVQIPRLVRLVRAARADPTNVAARADAIALASKLYTPTLDEWIDSHLKSGNIREVPTKIKGNPLPTSYEFDSYMTYCHSLAYFDLRVTLCGLILSLCAIEPPMPNLYPPHLDPVKVAAEDIRGAEWIAMGAENAHQHVQRMPAPFDLMRQNGRLSMSYGTWYRLEKRAGGEWSTDADAEKARMMRVWVRKMANELALKLGAVAPPEIMVVHKHEVYMGGPLPTR
ncbi:hypothetical protein GQ53DRAFT_756147 [Thozetella sp. PMI_491]|nr:hypothetical protein GQ53DRAFT_756147 [Thozetella sp. PMI_491]